jgi:TonB family protein
LKYLARYSILLVLLLGYASFCFAQNAKPSREQVSPHTAESHPETWQEFHSAEGRFSVLLPGIPSKKNLQADTPDGKIYLHTYSLRLSNQSPQFGVSYADLPVDIKIEDTRAIFNAARDDGLKAVKGKLLQEREDNHIGQPSRFYKVQTSEGMIRSRTLFVKNRFYTLSFTTEGKQESAATASLNDEAAAKFLDSFRLLTEQELAKFEGEVERMLKSLHEKNELVIGACTEEAKCEPLPGADKVGKAEVKSGGINSKPQPVYPPIAKAARAQGVVKIQVVVDEEGKVIAAQAVSGHPLLQSAAVKAAREALFAPTLLDGRPVKIAGVLTYNFVLQ